MMTFHVPTVN